MKNLILLLFVSFVMVQCTKDGEDDGPTIINPSASMKAKINGTQWSAVTRVVSNQSGNFIITGTGTYTGNQVIAITVFNEVEGTYTLDPVQTLTQFTANYTPDATSSDSIYQAYQGQVKITSVDVANKKITGTFNCKMRLATDINNEIEITEGTFTSLSYSE